MIDTNAQTSFDAAVTSGELSTSDLYAVLTSERRRSTIAVLTDESTPVDLTTIAHGVAARETDDEPEAVPAERVERIRAVLYHVHLPKLADVGLIEYDPDATTVTDYHDVLESLAI